VATGNNRGYSARSERLQCQQLYPRRQKQYSPSSRSYSTRLNRDTYCCPRHPTHSANRSCASPEGEGFGNCVICQQALSPCSPPRAPPPGPSVQGSSADGIRNSREKVPGHTPIELVFFQAEQSLRKKAGRLTIPDDMMRKELSSSRDGKLWTLWEKHLIIKWFYGPDAPPDRHLRAMRTNKSPTSKTVLDKIWVDVRVSCCA
jgi:hypothetical protein